MREFLQFERGAQENERRKKTKSNPWDQKTLLKELVKRDNGKKK